jgi:hypothetical protein
MDLENGLSVRFGLDGEDVVHYSSVNSYTFDDAESEVAWVNPTTVY